MGDEARRRQMVKILHDNQRSIKARPENASNFINARAVNAPAAWRGNCWRYGAEMTTIVKIFSSRIYNGNNKGNH